MAIAFDSTLGGTSANSYIPVARADDLLPLIVSSTRLATWTALVDADKQLYLMRAVRLLEAYMDWEGTKRDIYQPLGWPRDWIYGTDSPVVLSSNVVPQPVEEAQALMALNLAEGFDQADASSSPVDSVKISSIAVKFKVDRASRTTTLLPGEVIEKLRGYGCYVGSSGMAQSVQLER